MASRSAKGKGIMKSGMQRGEAPDTKKATPDIPAIAVQKEAAAPAHGFKRGGKVDGEKMKGRRMDKPARRASGGSVSMRGRSPYSAASKTSAPLGTQQDSG